MDKKLQGSTEYLLLIGGVVIVAVLAIALLLSVAEPVKENILTTVGLGSRDEIKILQTQEFGYALSKSVSPAFVDSSGAAPRNQTTFTEISAQRVAEKMILRGIAENDETFIEKGVKAIEYGFLQQNPDGSFRNGLGIAEDNPDALEADTFFLQAVGHSYLLIEKSSFKGKFLPRLVALKPQTNKALEFLEPHKETLFLKAADAPNRLAFDGLAFKLNGIVLGSSNYQKIGDEFIAEDLKTQTSEGVFLEKGGHDSSYQAVNLRKLEIYYIYTGNSRLADAIKKGIAWEKTMVNADTGAVSSEGNTRTGACQETFGGVCKDLDYEEIVLAFLYHGHIVKDSESLALAQKITDYAVAN